MANNRFNRSWFSKGGRHSIENRISDLHEFLNIDLKDKTALDIGCAEGDLIQHLKSSFLSVTGIEKSKKLYDEAVNRYKSDLNIEILHGDIEECSISNNFDYVFFLGVLHYYHDDDRRMKILEKIIDIANDYVFIRTGIYENKLKSVDDLKKLQKFTKLSTISEVASRKKCRWLFLDNSYRGDGNYRLGDLVVIKKIKCGIEKEISMLNHF